MAIVRETIHLDAYFTTIPNEWLRDPRLTLKARGLLALILSHRVGWRVTVASLARTNPEGKDAINAAIRELEDNGYMQRRITHDAGGKFSGVDYILTSAPFTENPHTGADYPVTANPHTKKNIIKEEQDKENQYQEPAASAGGKGALVQPKKDPAPTDFYPPQTPKDAANYIYYSTAKAIPFMGVLKIVEQLNKAGRHLTALAEAGVNLYQAGRPLTKTTIGQAVDGYERTGGRQSTTEKQQAMANVYQQLGAQDPTYSENPYTRAPHINPYQLTAAQHTDEEEPF